MTEPTPGLFSLVLHTHLPWLAHHGRWPVGEEWLYQSWSAAYLPLIRVLRTLAEEKTADLASIYDAEGRLLPVPEWPMVFRRGLVVGVESFEEYAGTGPDRVAVGMVRKVKLSDRIKHIELIGRHVGVQAFKDRAEHSGPNGGPIPVAAMIATPEEFARIAAEVAGNV